SAWLERAIDDRADQHFELLARDPFSHRFRFFALREIPFRPDHRLADSLDVFEGRPGPSCPPEAARYVRRGGEGAVDQELIDVVAAQVRVAVRREHLKNPVLDAQNGNVEGAASQIVDSDDAGMA